MAKPKKNSRDNATILITGAAGFVGDALLRSLLDEPSGFASIIATDIRPLADDIADDRRLVRGNLDIRDADAVNDLIAEHKPDVVVHLAAIVTPPPGDTRKLQYEVDVLGTRNVVQACAKHGVKQLIYTSSGAAYGYHPDNPAWLKESDPVRGNEVFAYAHHKRMVEEDLERARKDFPHLGQLIFRVSTVLGPRTDNQITGLFEQPVVPGIRGADSPFCIVADFDVVDAIRHGITTGKTGIYNLTGDGVLSLEEIARRMNNRYLPLPESIVRTALAALSSRGIGPYGPEQVLFIKHRPVLDNTALKRDFGFTPSLTTEEAFERYRKARTLSGPATVLITGAGGGLGFELARAHARRGDRLALLEHNPTALERTFMMARALGAKAIAINADLRNPDDCQRAVAQTTQTFGAIDILYNNAAIPSRDLFSNTTSARIEEVIDVNLMGAVRITEAALPWLTRSRGRICAISSVAGFAPLTGRTAYAASKHALHGFFDSLRTELVDQGVSITLACPAYIKTAFRKDARDNASELNPSEVADAIIDATLNRRRIALIGATARQAYWLHKLAPTLFERLMRRSVKDEFPT
ncbi:SDR family oxidoreductase [Lujinxingia vulgaris]|uniref:SDR family oxidoreductase n=1 Tax=Lujinxingia vulgaris TaxID=2600176 RepID=A0A5C6XAE0_9DELT|nr:SDR family oxidoreductase [Lujinxingia vulgaris]TXD38927.1 SDR family oxidoreductase [Lujinxingia vulgaris]